MAAPSDNSLLIAPCGMNCGLCMAYLRHTNKCPGCRGDDAGKPLTRTRCKIKTCHIFENETSEFCCQCENIPCDVLKRLDKRYHTKYGMSMIENLESIKRDGMKKFLKNEKVKWTCPTCGGMICVHNKRCYNCERKQ